MNFTAIYTLWLRQLKRYFRSKSRIIGSLGQPVLFLVALGFGISNVTLLPLAFVFMFLIALLFTALGTAIASVLQDMTGFQLIMNFLVMPIFFLSGSLFPPSGLPGILTTIVRVNPLAYGVD